MQFGLYLHPTGDSGLGVWHVVSEGSRMCVGEGTRQTTRVVASGKAGLSPVVTNSNLTLSSSQFLCPHAEAYDVRLLRYNN